MSFFEFLEKIQNKPRHIRLQILWLTVFVFMFAIISVWLVSLKSSLSLSPEKQESPKELSLLEEVKKAKSLSLKEALKASIGSFFNGDPGKELKNLLDSKETASPENFEGLEKIEPVRLPLGD